VGDIIGALEPPAVLLPLETTIPDVTLDDDEAAAGVPVAAEGDEVEGDEDEGEEDEGEEDDDEDADEDEDEDDTGGIAKRPYIDANCCMVANGIA